jgi:hypothetical protein
VRPDPLSEAAARRHELTRAKAVQALRELDRAGAPVTFAGVARLAGISRSGFIPSPTSAARSAGFARRQMEPAPPAPPQPASRPPTHRCAPGSQPPSTATSSSPTRTHGSAASSPAHSATSGPHGPDQVTIQTAETAADQASSVPSATLSTTGRPRSQPWLTRKLKITSRTASRYASKPSSTTRRTCAANRLLHNLPELQDKARAINARLLDTETVGQGMALVSPVIERITRPTVTDEGRKAPAPRFGDLRVQALAGTIAAMLFTVTGITSRSLRALMTGC